MKCPIKRYDGPVNVISAKEDISAAVSQLKRETILGFDTETRPTYKKGLHYPPALLQLAGKNEVFVFQLKHLGLPRPIRKILANPDIIKTGVSLDYDLIELAEMAPFKPAGFVDLEGFAEKAGIENRGLRGLAAVLLGFRIPKGARTSNWAKDTLTPSQITYAATDAWVGRELYNKFQKGKSSILPPASPSSV